jgi:LPPG:FO 2-phospho-L-lactate transferase
VRVALLCGGLGGARLAPYLAPGHDLTAICNVADDLEVMGLHVSPDVDSVLYALAGLFDEERGYGIRGDTGRFMARAAASGAETWFRIGDQDLGTHVLRTALLRSGLRLSGAVEALQRGLGIRASVIPASDEAIRTRVVSGGRDLDFQAFYVREAARPMAEGVRWEGIEGAEPAPGVLDALAGADLVVFGESSPVASILPILELGGVREALVATRAARVALSPVVASVAPEREVDRHHWRARERLMSARGLRHDPVSVAELYRGLVDVFVLDEHDRAFAPRISELGVMTRTADLLSRDEESRHDLVELMEEIATATAGAS